MKLLKVESLYNRELAEHHDNFYNVVAGKHGEPPFSVTSFHATSLAAANEIAAGGSRSEFVLSMATDTTRQSLVIMPWVSAETRRIHASLSAEPLSVLPRRGREWRSILDRTKTAGAS